MRRQLLLAVAMARLLTPGVALAAKGRAAPQLPRPKVEPLASARTRITFPAAGNQGGSCLV